MQVLENLVQREAKHLGNGVIKVDSFMNHQIDPEFMDGVGKDLSARFRHTKPTKILTAETSGIAPALAVGMQLKVPIVFARKHKPITMEEPFREISTSPTHGKTVELMVSPEYLGPGDKVLIIDDFLASAQTILALVRLIEQSKAELVGIGAVIEKVYAGGRELLKGLNVPVESVAAIEKCDGDSVVLQK